MNYYNEYDPKAAAWLRELIKEGLIAPGVVDERSITNVSADELSGYIQCHFFAGIGGWSYALRLAGVPDDEPVWTGSCPCQPFSAAGRQMGRADSRHLWPPFRRLINKCRPPVVYGEQVASNLGREWLAGVRSNLETMGYAVGASDLCAAGVGAPHIRQRLYWVADSVGERRVGVNTLLRSKGDGERSETVSETPGRRPDRRLANTDGGKRRDGKLQPGGQHGQQPKDGRAVRVGNSDLTGSQGRHERGHGADQWSPWTTSVVIPCTDGKARRIEPGSFPLAHGVSGRVGLLRGYGNAIVPQVAARFIKASR